MSDKEALSTAVSGKVDVFAPSSKSPWRSSLSLSASRRNRHVYWPFLVKEKEKRKKIASCFSGRWVASLFLTQSFRFIRTRVGSKMFRYSEFHAFNSQLSFLLCTSSTNRGLFNFGNRTQHWFTVSIDDKLCQIMPTSCIIILFSAKQDLHFTRAYPPPLCRLHGVTPCRLSRVNPSLKYMNGMRLQFIPFPQVTVQRLFDIFHTKRLSVVFGWR